MHVYTFYLKALCVCVCVYVWRAGDGGAEYDLQSNLFIFLEGGVGV